MLKLSIKRLSARKNGEGKFRTLTDWPHFFSESQPLYPMYKNHIYLDLFDFFHFLRDGFQGDLKTGVRL